MAEYIDFEVEVSDTENTAKDREDEVCRFVMTIL